jgi:uncharacterized protein
MGMKYLLLLGLAAAIWWSLSHRRNRETVAEARPEQKIVACAHCGVFVPENDAVSDEAGRRYCSVAHRADHAYKGG